MSRRPIYALLVFLGGAAACAQAGGKATGGELTPAGELAVAEPPFDAGPGAGAIDCDDGGANWTDLYNQVFYGGGRVGSCTYLSSCHGNMNGKGYNDPSGIQCLNPHDCRQSLIDRGLLAALNPANPGKSAALWITVRNPDNPANSPLPGGGGDRMPLTPSSFVMPQSCYDHINTWIAAGHPEN